MDPEDIDDLLEDTLDDYLLAIAQGIQQAQRQLDDLTVPGQLGQPSVSYHLPKVDFELKLTFAWNRQESSTAATAMGRTSTPTKKLMLQPAAKPGTDGFSSEATSIIRGSFVAVPVSGGKPIPRVRCALYRKGTNAIGLGVTVTDSVGNPQVDVAVQINVDRDRSAELSTPAGRQLSDKTDVQVGTLRTDATGYATTTLQIAKEPAGMVAVVIIDALGATETVMVQVGQTSSPVM